MVCGKTKLEVDEYKFEQIERDNKEQLLEAQMNQ